MRPAEKPKRGRPRKPPSERKRYTLSVRVRDLLRDELARDAAEHQRSLSEEAESRLERSSDDRRLMTEAMELAFGRPAAGLLIAIGGVIAGTASTIEWNSGQQLSRDAWATDPFAYDQVARAMAAVVDGFRPTGPIASPRAPNAPMQAILDDVGEIIAANGLLSLARKPDDSTPRLVLDAREKLGKLVERISPDAQQEVMQRAAKRSRRHVSSKA